MKKKSSNEEMRPKYDFSSSRRSPYAQRYKNGTNVIILDPDVAAHFPNSACVNDALRDLVRASERESVGKKNPGSRH